MGTNSDLADIFRGIADLLDIQGERFKPEAYRRAARSIESLPEDVRKVAARGGLDQIPGVGEAIGEKIREYLRSGEVSYYERLRKEVPPGVVEMMQIPGVGPKTARRFYVELQIEGPAELREAIRSGRLDGLSGFGPRKIAVLKAALDEARPPSGRTPLAVAYKVATAIVAGIRAGADVERIEVAGSFRRRRENVGDLDVLVTSRRPDSVFDRFSALDGIEKVVMRGPTKETVRWRSGLQIDLRVVEPEAFGAALVYFTGSKDHNIHLRSLARDRGLKINEYGVFREEERVGGATEEEVYRTLDLDWVPAEIREDRGEIEAAAAHRLPRLVEAADLKVLYHEHLPEFTAAALRTLTDAVGPLHLSHLGVVVTAAQQRELASLRSILGRVAGGPNGPGPAIVVGVEELLSGVGSGDLPEGVSYRVLRPAREGDALGPPPASSPPARSLFLAHLPLAHGGDSVPESTLGEWVDWAARHRVALEVTPDAPRDGLDSLGVRKAVEAKVPIVLHRGPAQLGAGGLDLALGLARRGWAEGNDVVNCRPPEDFIRPGRRAK